MTLSQWVPDFDRYQLPLVVGLLVMWPFLSNLLEHVTESCGTIHKAQHAHVQRQAGSKVASQSKHAGA